MDKLIIQNESDLRMEDVLAVLIRIVAVGRVSNNNTQYTYLTAFTVNGKHYHAVSDLNKKSDRFTIYNVHSA